LRLLIALVFIAASLISGWSKYFSLKDNHTEAGVSLKDWHLRKIPAGEISQLIHRPIPTDMPKTKVCLSTTADGVSIGPSHTAIWFKTQYMYRGHNQAEKRLDRLVTAFLSRES
jgi:hypothetical protein